MQAARVSAKLTGRGLSCHYAYNPTMEKTSGQFLVSTLPSHVGVNFFKRLPTTSIEREVDDCWYGGNFFSSKTHYPVYMITIIYSDYELWKIL